MSSNLLSSNLLALNALGSSTLSSDKLSTNELIFNTQSGLGLEQTKSGRELLNYIAICALPKGVFLKTTAQGKQFKFSGNLGLAPDWLKKPLSESGQKWISACLLAHVNAFGIKVPISLRSAHPSLSGLDPHEITEYPVQEAAFYGNIFRDQANQYVCKGNNLGTETKYLQWRVCSQVKDTGKLTLCNFVFQGNCGHGDDSGPYETPACKGQAGTSGFYTKCRGDAKIYNEVITVYLKSLSSGSSMGLLN